MTLVFKIVADDAWQEAVETGSFKGASIDIVDGFIHLSAADQAVETAAKHFTRQDGLVLVAYDADKLGKSLVWEVSRSGALFPHFYGVLTPADALWVKPLPLSADGMHVFPPLDA